MSWLSSAAKLVVAPLIGLGTVVVVNHDFASDDPVPEPVVAGDVTGDLVSLGDSYSSGEGLSPYLGDTGDGAGANRCHRSDRAYAAVLEQVGGTSELRFRACAGAEIAEVIDREQQHGTRPPFGPQVDAATADASTITLTIGGNDLRFAEVVAFCAKNRDCLDDDDWPHGATLREWAIAELATTTNRLVSLYDELQAQAPNARLVVLGYPLLFAGEEVDASKFRCRRVYKAVFEEHERRDLRLLIATFNDGLAAAARGAGVEYVHVADAFDGHETCGELGPWLDFLPEGVFEFVRSGLNADPANFHPTADGQRMMARLVACYLRLNPDGAGDGSAVGRKGDAVYECAHE